MSHSHHMKTNQDFPKHQPQHIKESEEEKPMSNAKKPHLLNQTPISGPGKHMGHNDSNQNLEDFLNKHKGSIEGNQTIVNNVIPQLSFTPLVDCKNCLGSGYKEKSGKFKICRLCAEKSEKCVKCGGTGMKNNGKNCKRCSKL